MAERESGQELKLAYVSGTRGRLQDAGRLHEPAFGSVNLHDPAPMAFPRDAAHVVSYLRAIYATHAESEPYSSIYIDPLPLKDAGSATSNRQKRPESPPITFNMLDNLNWGAAGAPSKPQKKLALRKKTKSRKNRGSASLKNTLNRKESTIKNRLDQLPSEGDAYGPPESDVSAADYLDLLDVSDRTSSSSERTKISSRAGKPTKNKSRFVPRIRFVKSYHQKGSENDLELIEEEITEGQHPITLDSDLDGNDDRITLKESYAGNDASTSTESVFPENSGKNSSDYTLSLDDRVEDDASKTTYPQDDENEDEDDEDVEDEDEDDEDEDDDDDDDDEDEYDLELDVDDISSSDSAFTDIEGDSVIESSLLYSFDSSSNFPFGNSSMLDSKRLRRKKAKLDSYEESAESSGATSKIQSQAGSVSSTNPLIRSKSFQLRGKLSVERVEPQRHKNLTSNLSSLISSKANNTNKNPLEYYDFVGNLAGGSGAKISIFLPPKTTPSTAIIVNSGIAVADCIGYILLTLFRDEKLSTVEEIKSMNPNYWKLELVDEDGENYGSFGILDRARLLSSYNNPTELALCPVSNDGEFIRNQTQTPLPAEFQVALEDFQKSKNLHMIEDETSPTKTKEGLLTEIKILKVIEGIKFPQYEIFTILLPSYSTVEDAIKEFCTFHRMDALHYNLREMFLSNNQHMDTLRENDVASPSAWEFGRILSRNEIVTNTTEAFEIIADTNTTISIGNETFLNAGITPAVSTPLKSSPHGKIASKLEALSMDDESTKISDPVKKLPKLQQKRNTENELLVLDQIIQGKNLDLPTNLNTIYFKWKVWRRKATLLNRIEKSLIIDGDYIHLAPSDEAMWKLNPTENSLTPGMQHSGSTHHHHYLHHYNYSNYYNKLMMKTSSFHVTQIVKLKRYLNKSPNHFKIVINKQPDKTGLKERDSNLKKKYDLEASNSAECEEIIKKIKWVLQVYNMSNLNI